jgi:hypothetical protein
MLQTFPASIVGKRERRRLMLGSDKMVGPLAIDQRNEIVGSIELLSKHACASEGLACIFCSIAFRDHQCWSKQELKDRLMAAMEFFNRDPVIHTWTYKLDEAVCYDSNLKIDDLV